MVIERDLVKLCKDVISLLLRLEEGLISKEELKEHLDKKVQFLQFSSNHNPIDLDKKVKP